MNDDRHPLPPNARLQPLPPQAAIDYLQGKRLLASFDWQDLWQEEHNRALVVAKMARLDLLQAVQSALVDAVRDGTGLAEFTARLKPLLEREGWWGKKLLPDPLSGELVEAQLGSPRRLQTIYEVNTRQAYAVGRWARIEQNKAVLPYVRYVTRRDERVRASHRSWHGLTLPVDHPFWQTHAPPNGWRCRCSVYALSASAINDLREGGEVVRTEAPIIEWADWTNTRTGEVRRVPVGIDPGFGYNPGQAQARAASQSAALLGKLDQVAPALAQAHVRDFFDSGDFGRWHKQLQGAIATAEADERLAALSPAARVQQLQTELGRGEVRGVAVLPPALRPLLGESPPVVRLGDPQLIAQLAQPHPLNPADYAQLPALIAAPQQLVQLGPRWLLWRQINGKLYQAELATGSDGALVLLALQTTTPADAAQMAQTGQLLIGGALWQGD